MLRGPVIRDRGCEVRVLTATVASDRYAPYVLVAIIVRISLIGLDIDMKAVSAWHWRHEKKVEFRRSEQ